MRMTTSAQANTFRGCDNTQKTACTASLTVFSNSEDTSFASTYAFTLSCLQMNPMVTRKTGRPNTNTLRVMMASSKSTVRLRATLFKISKPTPKDCRKETELAPEDCRKLTEDERQLLLSIVAVKEQGKENYCCHNRYGHNDWRINPNICHDQNVEWGRIALAFDFCYIFENEYYYFNF